MKNRAIHLLSYAVVVVASSCSHCAECEKFERTYDGISSSAKITAQTDYPKQEYCYEALDAILENDSSEVIVTQDSGSYKTVTYYTCDE